MEDFAQSSQKCCHTVVGVSYGAKSKCVGKPWPCSTRSQTRNSTCTHKARTHKRSTRPNSQKLPKSLIIRPLVPVPHVPDVCRYFCVRKPSLSLAEASSFCFKVVRHNGGTEVGDLCCSDRRYPRSEKNWKSEHFEMFCCRRKSEIFAGTWMSAKSVLHIQITI